MIYENLNFEYIKGKKQSNVKFVLLHGWGHCIENLKPIAKMLCDYDCYLVDLPGFGKSPIPTDVLSISEYSSIVADFIKGFKNKDDKVVVIGHSFGGRISLDLASNYPSLVNKINSPLNFLFKIFSNSSFLSSFFPKVIALDSKEGGIIKHSFISDNSIIL